jgi:hypothetical protein
VFTRGFERGNAIFAFSIGGAERISAGLAFVWYTSMHRISGFSFGRYQRLVQAMLAPGDIASARGCIRRPEFLRGEAPANRLRRFFDLARLTRDTDRLKAVDRRLVSGRGTGIHAGAIYCMTNRPLNNPTRTFRAQRGMLLVNGADLSECLHRLTTQPTLRRRYLRLLLHNSATAPYGLDRYPPVGITSTLTVASGAMMFSIVPCGFGFRRHRRESRRIED